MRRPTHARKSSLHVRHGECTQGTVLTMNARIHRADEGADEGSAWPMVEVDLVLDGFPIAPVEDWVPAAAASPQEDAPRSEAAL